MFDGWGHTFEMQRNEFAQKNFPLHFCVHENYVKRQGAGRGATRNVNWGGAHIASAGDEKARVLKARSP